MNKKVKYMKASIIIAIFLLLIVSDCSPKFKSSFYHDDMNPCGLKYHDSIECENWKIKFPKEYQRYLNRTTKDSIQ